jgi:hypothetical protein
MATVSFTQGEIELIAELANPLLEQISGKIAAAFPDKPDEMYAAALGFQLAALLDGLSDPKAKNVFYHFLTGLAVSETAKRLKVSAPRSVRVTKERVS